jgi:hypothetical protein
VRYLFAVFASKVNRRGYILVLENGYRGGFTRRMSIQNVVTPNLRISILQEGEDFIVNGTSAQF